MRRTGRRWQAESLRESFKFAGEGFFYALRSQRNMRWHAVAALLAVAAGLGLELARWEWLVLVLLIGLVWAAEIINTALETVVDLCCPQEHPLAKKAKDLAAAGVLVLAVTAAIAGILLLVPHLIKMTG